MQEPIYNFIEGDWTYQLDPVGFSDDVDAMQTGILRGQNRETGEARDVALAWDNERNVVDVGGVDALHEREAAALERAGFNGVDAFRVEDGKPFVANYYRDWHSLIDAVPPLTRNGTDGRVYGGDPNLIHVDDGRRAEVGRWLAHELDTQMRNTELARRLLRGEPDEPAAEAARTMPLCPGCFMVVLFNAARELAIANGQPLSELGRSMAAAFEKLATNPEAIESIEVMLDAEPCPVREVA